MHVIRTIKNAICVVVSLWSGNASQVSVVERIGGHDTVNVALMSVVEASGALETSAVVIAGVVSMPAVSDGMAAHPILSLDYFDCFHCCCQLHCPRRIQACWQENQEPWHWTSWTCLRKHLALVAMPPLVLQLLLLLPLPLLLQMPVMQLCHMHYEPALHTALVEPGASMA